MSWIDRIKDKPLKIITGDGNEWTGVWKGMRRNIEMNASIYDFNNIEKSYVTRGKVSSAAIEFQFWIQGENQLDYTDAFEVSSRDIRPWTLSAPELSIDILVQPSRLSISQTDLGVTLISGQLYETIPDTFPDSAIDQKSAVKQAVEQATQTLSENYAETPPPDAATQAAMGAAIEDIGEEFSLLATTLEGLQAVLDAVRNALAALDNIIADITAFADAIAALARLPGQLLQSVKDRVKAIKKAFDTIKNAVQNLQNLSFKSFFEDIAGIFVGAASEASVTSATENAENFDTDTDIVDYASRTDVIDQIDFLNTFQQDYIDTLGLLQSEVDATPTSFTPNYDSILAVKRAVSLAAGGLLQIAVGTRQERSYTVPKATSIILLCHRLLGKTDETIEEFERLNDIKLSESILIPKGRELIYYV